MVITGTLQTAANAIGQWRTEHSSINGAIGQLRRWIAEALRAEPASWPEPLHGELAMRLRAIAESMRSHFQLTGEIYDALGAEFWCIEVESAKRIAAADHDHLLVRLDSLIARLCETPSTFASLADAVEELEWIFDQLDQHEESVSDSFEWLLLTDCG